MVNKNNLRCIEKAIPADMTAKWFHDNVYEYLSKALRVSLVGDSITIPGEDPLASSIDAVISLTAGTPMQEAKVGAVIYAGRKLVYLQPLDGAIWWGSDVGVTVNNGIKLFKSQLMWIPAGTMPIYLSRDAADVNVSIVEAK